MPDIFLRLLSKLGKFSWGFVKPCRIWRTQNSTIWYHTSQTLSLLQNPFISDTVALLLCVTTANMLWGPQRQAVFLETCLAFNLSIRAMSKISLVLTSHSLNVLKYLHFLETLWQRRHIARILSKDWLQSLTLWVRIGFPNQILPLHIQ